MPLVSYKPTAPGRRGGSVLRGDVSRRLRPEKRLLVVKRNTGGRNAQGKITVRHHGGGARRIIRVVDFLRKRLDVPATVIGIAYDPNRNARLALIEYPDRERAYILAPHGLEVGQQVVSSNVSVPIRTGNRLPLERLPIGTMVHSVELQPGQGGRIAHGAGAVVQLMAIDGRFAQLKLPSGEIRLVPSAAAATIGQVGNSDARLVRLGKAGRNRHRGVRPRVRGKAMNPVDHPHGGGEGNTSIGLTHPKTPWGKHALGVKTRRAKKWSRVLILQRRKTKHRR